MAAPRTITRSGTESRRAKPTRIIDGVKQDTVARFATRAGVRPGQVYRWLAEGCGLGVDIPSRAFPETVCGRTMQITRIPASVAVEVKAAVAEAADGMVRDGKRLIDDVAAARLLGVKPKSLNYQTLPAEPRRQEIARRRPLKSVLAKVPTNGRESRRRRLYDVGQVESLAADRRATEEWPSIDDLVEQTGRSKDYLLTLLRRKYECLGNRRARSKTGRAPGTDGAMNRKKLVWRADADAVFQTLWPKLKDSTFDEEGKEYLFMHAAEAFMNFKSSPAPNRNAAAARGRSIRLRFSRRTSWKCAIAFAPTAESAVASNAR